MSLIQKNLTFVRVIYCMTLPSSLFPKIKYMTLRKVEAGVTGIKIL
jgi:hypothetical protein